MVRLVTLVTCMGALLLLGPSAALAGGEAVSRDLYEWHPNGEGTNPQIVLEEKLDLSGKFDVQCQRVWIFLPIGGGGTADPFKLTNGTLSGSYLFPTKDAGYGSSATSAEINYNDFHNAGPLDVQLSGTATAEKAVGTLSLKLYRLVKVKRHGHRKLEKELSASCAVHFEAPNFYYEAPAAAESPPPETGEE